MFILPDYPADTKWYVYCLSSKRCVNPVRTKPLPGSMTKRESSPFSESQRKPTKKISTRPVRSKASSSPSPTQPCTSCGSCNSASTPLLPLPTSSQPSWQLSATDEPRLSYFPLLPTSLLRSSGSPTRGTRTRRASDGFTFCGLRSSPVLASSSQQSH